MEEITNKELSKLVSPINDPVNRFWDEAIRRHRAANPGSQMKKGCQSCRIKVLKWLKHA